MALSTTQSIWRSGGGDQTRTAYCGSGLMAAQFYIPDASESANVLNKASGVNLILPAGAVVVSVSITTTGTGSVDIGTTGYTSGTATPAAIANNLSVATAATTSIGTVVTGTASTELAYVTSRSDTSGNDPVTGVITYFVVDPLVGQQNV